MEIHFNLTSPKQENSPVRVIVSQHGKQYRKSVGITVKTSTWKNEKTNNAKINEALRLIKTGLESALDFNSDEKAILRVIERVQRGKWNEDTTLPLKAPKRPSFWAYFKEWSERDNPAIRQRRLAYNLISDLMGTEDDWEDIDSAFHERLLRKMNEAKYSKNYQGTMVAKLKTVMGEGFRLKYHKNEEFRSFAKPSNETDSVYLTQRELDRIWNLELKDHLEQKARDLLILGCYSGARWEDFSQFTKDNVTGKELRYIQRKTGARVTIPVSPKVKEVLKRNGGKAPKMVDVVFNKTVKVVCMRAKVNTPVEIRVSRGESYEHQTVPKWKMVSSHTCRRTCCTLLAQQNVPLNLIMQVSGHKSLTSLQKYLRQSLSDATEELSKLEYFR